MKTFKSLLWLFTLTFLLAGSLSAKESFNYTIDIVKCSKAPEKRLLDKNQWQNFLKNSNAIVLDSMQGVAEEGDFSMVHAGQKNPIAYKDPRAGMYQVQYVDLGLKIDIMIVTQKNGTIYIESRGERSVASPIQEHPEPSSVMLYETGVTMKKGQAVAVASIRGVMTARYLKNQFPDVAITESDYLMMVITVE